MLNSLVFASVAFLSLTRLSHAAPQAGFTSTLFASTTSTQAAAPTTDIACNNSPLLCSRNYNNITHMGAHDAAFVRDQTTGFSTSGNQYYNATVALSAGIRLIQAQVHKINGTLRLCHSSCSLLDAGPLKTWLSDIKAWMDSNPNEVVTLILVNSDGVPAATLGADFSASGISTYGYTPSTTAGPMATWPSLQTMISANTRLVTFIASINYDSAFPYLLPEFNFVFETAFGVTSSSKFDCALNRPSSAGSAASAISAGYMGMANHFLDVEQAFGIQTPDTDNLNTTNSAITGRDGTLGAQGQQCASEWGVKPTFLLVNFFNVGPSITTADNLNGIVASGRKSVSTERLTSNSSSGGATLKVIGYREILLVMVTVALGSALL